MVLYFPAKQDGRRTATVMATTTEYPVPTTATLQNPEGDETGPLQQRREKHALNYREERKKSRR